MTQDSIERARRIGSRKAAVGFLWVFLLFEVFALFVETREDFANGLLFFLRGQTDKVFIGLVAVIFCTVVLLGRAAGKQILVDERHHIVVAMTNTLYTLLAGVGYVWVVVYTLRLFTESWWSLVILLALISGCIWLITVRGITRQREG